MNYLAVDTSGKALNLIVCKDGEIFCYDDVECGVRHSEKIMVEIENLIEKSNFDFSRADFVACVVGAGSFTGIRIGVSTVKATCFAYNIPFLAVTSFDTLAYNKESGRVLAVIDAGHNGFYVCGYDNLKVDLQPSYILIDELNQLSKEYQLISSGEIAGFEVEVVDIKEGLIKAVEKKKEESETDLDLLTPLYVRKSQAEEGR